MNSRSATRSAVNLRGSQAEINIKQRHYLLDKLGRSKAFPVCFSLYHDRFALSYNLQQSGRGVDK
jgi:hypothetical protein